MRQEEFTDKHAHPDIARAYMDLARVCKSLGEIDDALDFYVKSLRIRKELFLHESPASRSTSPPPSSTSACDRVAEVRMRMEELYSQTEALVEQSRESIRSLARSRRSSISSTPTNDHELAFTKALLEEVTKFDSQGHDQASESDPSDTSHVEEAEKLQRFARAWRHEIPDLWGPAEQLLTAIQCVLDCVGVTLAERVREEHARFFAVIRC